MNDIDKAATLASHLADVTSNLGRYIEGQAQQIAHPRIEAAGRERARFLDRLREDHAAELRREQALVAELRRHVDAVNRASDRMHRKLKACHAFVGDLRASGLDREADELATRLNRSGFAESEPDGRVDPRSASDARVWSVMLREDDGYVPVGVDGDRATAEDEMYDWARDCPGQVAYGYYDRTGWQLSDEELTQ